MRTVQLPLNLKLHDETIFDNFIVGQHALLIQTLKNFVVKKSESFIYCYGESGVGKTHLLQACCHARDDIFYISLSDYKELSPTVFDSLEFQPCVCIDDVDAIAGNLLWEEALFYFYNRARDHSVFLLMSAKIVPKQLTCVLSDLQSRLSSALILEIKDLTDQEKIQALKMRAASRGLFLSEEVTHYLIHHYSRNMRDLFCVLEKLDHASLIAKRRLTIPFVKSVL